MLVLVATQLLAIARDEQQRVVGADPEDEDRQDRGGLAVDRHARLRQAVTERAGGELGEDDRQQGDPEEDRAAVDEREQDQHEQQPGTEQGAVDALEDLDLVGRIAGRAGDLRLQAAAGVADALAHRVDRVEDRRRLAVAGDLRLHDRGGPVARRANGARRTASWSAAAAC